MLLLSTLPQKLVVKLREKAEKTAFFIVQTVFTGRAAVEVAGKEVKRLIENGRP